ncbi:PACE efflux transporter [Shewanella litorisediminis]|uniref:PACE efflux transporter n=1 Tax=Shewanella litorisediminis TaxID=1173586 RepID=A0ABX7G0E6_9GAMM|nr:PACE efflux transporter [Shewanella litorisediminis]MCL2918193.1 PACE efflux transporter [Shewanella litorisediminis]QRH00754.1 PACE efflux transporter [Shewanella litorisediminis]
MGRTIKKSRRERLFQALLFESVALLLLVPLSTLIAGQHPGDMAIVTAALSLYAVCWSYVYNQRFEWLCQRFALQKNAVVRVCHILGFELGLMLATLPAVAWYLHISLWQALLLETGFLVFFLLYGLVFYWVYDEVRRRSFEQEMTNNRLSSLRPK